MLSRVLSALPSLRASVAAEASATTTVLFRQYTSAVVMGTSLAECPVKCVYRIRSGGDVTDRSQGVSMSGKDHKREGQDANDYAPMACLAVLLAPRQIYLRRS